MPTLVYLDSSRDDLLDLMRHITKESGSRAVAHDFVGGIRARCRHLAGLSGTLGQARPELCADMRSTPHRGYLIFFRYAGERLEIVNVLAARRDIDGFFGED